MKEKKRDIKKIIFAILLGCVYLFLIFLLIEWNQTTTLVIGYHTKWNIANGKWENIEWKSSMDYETYHVLLDKKELGDYKLKLDKGMWELYNKQNELVRKNGEVFAYLSNNELLLYSSKEEVTEIDTAMTKVVLEELGIDTKDMTFTNEEKLVLDIDGDGKEEQIISAINTNYDELFGNQAVSIVYMMKDGHPKVILYDNPTSTFLGTKFYSIYGTIQFGKEKKKTLIISQDTFGEHIPSCHYAFDITKEEMMLVSSCENEVEQ